MAADDEGSAAAASAQLHHDLRSSITRALASRRPILTHLNADTSWFLQIPRPESAVRRGGRAYYNILIDPWLEGGQSDVAGWFSQQWHATPSRVGSIAELEVLAREAEALAKEGRVGDTSRRSSKIGGKERINGGDDEDDEDGRTLIDAVAISHEFTDHCHKDTLLTIQADVPVFAIKEAANLISSWKHFRTVVTVDAFTSEGNDDWRATSILPLPNWIGIGRLLQTDDVLNYHSALIITFNNGQPPPKAAASNPVSPPTNRRKRKSHPDPPSPDSDDESAEAIIYTPHGMHAHDLALIPRASPSIYPLAFLHGLHNVRVGTARGRTALQSNLGAHNGLQAQRVLKARYWIGTHDEVKKGGGLVSWFLQRDVLTVEDAVELERTERVKRGGLLGEKEVEGSLDGVQGTNWVHLGNGESRVLV